MNLLLELGIHGTIGLGLPPAEVPTVVGGGTTAALGLHSRFHLEAGADFGLRTQEGTWFGTTGGARVFLGKRERVTPSIQLGGGYAFEEGGGAYLQGGVALDLPRGADGSRPRLGLTYGITPGGNQRLIARVGAVFGKARRPKPVPIPPPVVSAPPPKEPLETGMVWMPTPVCEWLPSEEAEEWVTALDLSSASLTLANPRTLRGAETSGEDGSGEPLAEEDTTAPPRLLVAAYRGDQVTVAGQPLSLEQGIGVVRAGEEFLEIRVEGGGRVDVQEVALAADHAVWFNATEPETLNVSFPNGQATLTASERARLDDLMEHAGDWRFEVQGGHSASGSLSRNQALALERAQAVYDYLVTQSSVDGQVTLLEEVLPPTPGVPADIQRSARIRPVENQ